MEDSDDACESSYDSSGHNTDESLSDGDYSSYNDMESTRKKVPYRILTEQVLCDRQSDSIEQVTTLLGIPENEAEHVLRQYKWDPNRLNEEWWNDSAAVRTKAGLIETQLATSTSRVRGPKVPCNICFEEYRTSNMCAAPCKHYFCKDCWKGYVSEAISNGPTALSLCCPVPECRIHVPSTVISEVACQEDLERYNRYRLRSFVEDNRSLEWCPAPDCEYAVESCLDLQGEPLDVICNCGSSFCFTCKEEAHRPVNCRTVKQWLVKNSAESENLNWILANTKACPKCKRPIEKNQGCMHMTCSQCKYQFCWLCLASWSEHGDRTGGYYACNRYNSAKEKGEYDEEAQKREHAKHALERYMHYYHRWAENDKARKAALQKMKTTQLETLETLSNFYATPTSQLKFILDAWSQVVDCRRILKWTYAFGFYNFDESIEQKQSAAVLKQQQEFFEFNQGQAESYLEHLHGVAEKDLEALAREDSKVDMQEWAKFRQRLIGLTEVTKSHFEKLVQHFFTPASLQELEKGMANMLDAYNGPKSDSQHEDGWPGEEQVKDSKKKNPQAKQSAKATGKRTRASQRNAGGGAKAQDIASGSLDIDPEQFLDFWQCSSCTYANKNLDATACEMCEVHRSRRVL